jgi:hypothetical protein
MSVRNGNGKYPIKKKTYPNMDSVWSELGLTLEEDGDMATAVEVVSSAAGGADR